MHALDGMKVLDLSRVLAGPWCTQTLADLGADVWKLETPAGGDDTRGWKPPDIGGESTYFLCCNRSKRSIAVDFRTPDGRRIVQGLAQKADVVVENFKLGTLEKYGLDHSSLSALNERLIYCSISGYGRTGSRAGEAGYDFAIQAESGLMSITGEVDGPPMKLGVAITDIITGMNATQAILAALLVRERTGQGQLIDLSLLDGAVAVLASVASAHLATGTSPRRFGNAHPTVAPYQTFATADGIFALAVGNDRQFSALCGHILNHPEWAKDVRFLSNEARAANVTELERILAREFASKTTQYWLENLRLAGVPAGQVRSVPEALASPEVTEREMVMPIADARHGMIPMMASPLKLRGTPTRSPSAPPRLGEHTDEILSDILHADPTTIANWRRNGVIA